MAPTPSNTEAVIDRLRDTPAAEQRLRRQDFTLTNGTAGKRSLIAEYEAELPIAFRTDAMRLVFTVVEEFTTDGTASNTETFTLANNVLEQPNSADIVLFEDGTRVQPDAIDYANNSFDYTSTGTGTTLDAFYVARDPVQIEIAKSAPRSQGGASEVVYDDVTSILHERNQNREPPRMDFAGDHPLTPVVPRKWTVEIYAEGPVATAWDDAGTGTDNANARAINAIVNLPINRSQDDVEGLAAAVRREVVGTDPSV